MSHLGFAFFLYFRCDEIYTIMIATNRMNNIVIVAPKMMNIIFISMLQLLVFSAICNIIPIYRKMISIHSDYIHQSVAVRRNADPNMVYGKRNSS